MTTRILHGIISGSKILNSTEYRSLTIGSKRYSTSTSDDRVERVRAGNLINLRRTVSKVADDRHVNAFATRSVVISQKLLAAA